MKKPQYPPGFAQDLADEEFQCCYCGRFMKRRVDARVVRYEGWKLHSCLACEAILTIGRTPKTFAAKQKRVRQVLRIERPFNDQVRVYVGQDGVGRVELRKGAR